MRRILMAVVLSVCSGLAGQVAAENMLLVKAEKGKNKSASVKTIKVPGQELVKIESVRDWSMIIDDKSKLDIAMSEGLTSKSQAVVLNYDMGKDGLWVQAFKEGTLGLLEGDVLAFAHKGEGKNSFEVKLEMASGETFGILFEGEVATSGWQVKEIPLTELDYFWGGTGKTLDPARVRKIFFAVSKKADDVGGKGFLAVTSISKVSLKK